MNSLYKQSKSIKIKPARQGNWLNKCKEDQASERIFLSLSYKYAIVVTRKIVYYSYLKAKG